MKRLNRKFLVAVAGILILGLAGSVVLAQERPQSVVSTSDMGLVLGSINMVEYERAIGAGMSFYVAAGIGWGDIFGAAMSIFSVTSGIKKYLRDTAPEGFWFGGFAGFFSARVWGESASGFAGGGNVGYKSFITDRLTIEGRLGGMFLTSSELRFFGPAAGVNVGYAF